MKKFFYISIISALLVACKPSLEVGSRNGSLLVRFEQTEQGGIGYSVYRDGEVLIETSPLGFETTEGELKEGFELKAVEHYPFDEIWETVWGEERLIADHHNTMIVHLKHANSMLLDIEFRVFNDGFAFRYIFPEQEKQKIVITDELTAYSFKQDAEAWSIPWRTEYYEGLWEKRGISGHPSAISADTLCSPITIEFADGSYGFLHEAALTGATHVPDAMEECTGKRSTMLQGGEGVCRDAFCKPMENGYTDEDAARTGGKPNYA